MPLKPSKALFTSLILSTLILFYLYSTFLSLSSLSPTKVPIFSSNSSLNHCNLFNGKWVFDPNQKPMYDETCPFHRNAWNCLKNKRDNMGVINSWKWVPDNCSLGKIDPFEFLGLMRNKNIGFVGDSLNENFIVSFLCVLRDADNGSKKWKKKGAWRGAYFPKFNVTVAYHRAVLLSKYQDRLCGEKRTNDRDVWGKLDKPQWHLGKYYKTTRNLVSLDLTHLRQAWARWQENKSNEDGLKGIYRVDVDAPANDWVHITKFYDVLVFNTGHWWGAHKFPKETPLVFYQRGRPISPPLDFIDGLRVVLKSIISYIDKEVPSSTLKFWRLQSPRHFFGGEWNQNGSCLFDQPLEKTQLDLWFDPSNNGVNKEARQLNQVIEEALQGSDIQKLDLAHLSEYRADAHPAIWLGKKDAVAVWGQDCMHWCLPGVPDTWVDILTELIRRYFGGNT